MGSLAFICPAFWCSLLGRWPRWFPRHEFQSTTRPVFGQWVPRICSHPGSIDLTIYSSCSSGSAGGRTRQSAESLNYAAAAPWASPWASIRALSYLSPVVISFQAMAAVSSQKPGLDRLQFDLYLRILASKHGKQIAGQHRHAVPLLDRSQQRGKLVQTLGFDQAELRRMTADGVAQLRATHDQLVAHAQQHQCRLLLSRLHRHIPHSRPARRLTQPLGIAPIILFALHIVLHQLRSDPLYRLPHLA